MTPDQHEAHLLALHDAVVEIKATLNNGLKAAMVEQRTEMKAVKADVQSIRDSVQQHIAKEDVLFEIFRRVLNTGFGLVGTLVVTLLAIIGWLFVHPNTWINP